MAKTKAFWNRQAAKYAAKPIEHPEDYQKKLTLTREYLTPDSHVLEFGCGTGGTAIQHAPLVKHYRAIDISDKMLSFGEKKAKAASITNLDFDATCIERLALEPESLDAILGLSVLHMLDDKDAVIRKVFQALKPGGVFITSTVCLGDIIPVIKYIIPIGQVLGLMPAVSVFTADNLRQSLQQANFTITHDWVPAKGRAVFIIASKPAA